MPDENQIGRFIAELRKERGLTQKQLAGQLDVTDKAVSKWERGMGYPDITLLSKLAHCLGVSTGELLNGARDSVPAPEAEQAVETTLKYAEQVSSRRHISLTRLLLAAVTLLCALAIGICMICDFSLNGAFTWVIYPASSILFGWLVLAPVLYFRRYRLTMGLISLSLFILPYLLVLDLALNGGWFWGLALPCALASLACLWLVLLVQFIAHRLPCTLSMVLTLLPILSFSIQLAIWRHLAVKTLDAWDAVSVLVCWIIALLLFLKGRRRSEAQGITP